MEAIIWTKENCSFCVRAKALQETESTNYVIGVLSDSLDYDALPTI